MLGYWLQTWLRKCLPGGRLRKRSSRRSRRVAYLHVEPLEQRTLAAVLPLAHLAPPVELPRVSSPLFTSAINPGAPDPERSISPDDTVALDQLLNDVRQVDAAPAAGAVSPFRLGQAGLNPDTSGLTTLDDPAADAPPLHRVVGAPSDPSRAASNDVTTPLNTTEAWTAPAPATPNVASIDRTAQLGVGTIPVPVTVARTEPTSLPPGALSSILATPEVTQVTGGTVQTATPATAGAPWSVSASAVASPPAVMAVPASLHALNQPDAVVVDTGAPAALAEIGDGPLLQRYVQYQDQAAFDTLVRRHERFVMSVCRRVLTDAHAAEDAVQATFLVLARKAGLLDPHRPLASWLYMVAYHIALRVRAVLARRRRTDLDAARGRPASLDAAPGSALEAQEVHQVLREELQQLPDQYRVPLALCYFDGQTHAEAARTIGMPRGSIAKRIGEGLALLRQRLTDRGVAL